MENKRDLSKKHLRDQAKRAKDIGKRTREAKSKEPAHHVDATGEDDVTQTQILRKEKILPVTFSPHDQDSIVQIHLFEYEMSRGLNEC